MFYKVSYDFSFNGDYEFMLTHKLFNKSSMLSGKFLTIKEFELKEQLLFYSDFSLLPEIDFPNNDLVIPIASEKMLNIIKNVGVVNLRLFPVTLFDFTDLEPFDENGKLKSHVNKLTNYSSFQFTEYTDALDYEKSEFGYSIFDPNKIVNVIKTVLKSDCKTPPMFRINYSPDIFITEDLKMAFEKGGIKGCKYYPVKLS